MVKQEDNKSIAEAIMDGDRTYSDLIKVDKLDDGTYLVFEKEHLFGPRKGFMRVHRLDSNDYRHLCGAVVPYYSYNTDEEIIDSLRSYILTVKF